MRCEAMHIGIQCPAEGTHEVCRTRRTAPRALCCLHFEQDAARELAEADERRAQRDWKRYKETPDGKQARRRRSKRRKPRRKPRSHRQSTLTK